MSLPYTQDNEVSDRYVNTIIFCSRVPVYVHSVRQGIIQCQEIGTQKQTMAVASNDPLLRDGPFVLGYINGVQRSILDRTRTSYIVKSSSVYASRIPIRRSKQGITAENLGFKNPDRTYNVGFNKLFTMDSFRDMLIGKYPSYDYALGSLSNKNEIVAFSSKIAVGLNELGMYDLHYRGDKVASAVESDKWILSNKFKFLKEYLQTKGVRTW